MQPQAPWWSRGLLLPVFWDHIYLKWIVCVSVWEGLSERLCVSVEGVHVDVHVQEDASLTTHSLLDAFN